MKGRKWDGKQKAKIVLEGLKGRKITRVSDQLSDK